MKSHITFLAAFLVLSLCGQYADAQSDEKSQFLLKSPLKFSGFGALIYEFSGVNGDFTVSTGGGGALLINQQMFIGLYGLGSHHHTRVVVNGEQFDRARLNFGHGGLWMGYIHRSHELIHYGVSTKIGGGNIELTDNDVRLFDEEREIGHEEVFVFTPQVEVEVNVLKWLKLNAGLGYRVVTEVDMADFRNGDFSSFQGTFTLMFGWFNQ
jgi:hypothetical protein